MSSTSTVHLRPPGAHPPGDLWLVALGLAASACSAEPLADVGGALDIPKAHASALQPSVRPLDPDACIATTCERPAASPLSRVMPVPCEETRAEGTVLWWHELGTHPCILGECTAESPEPQVSGTGELWVRAELGDPEASPFTREHLGHVWTQYGADGAQQFVRTRDRVPAVGRRADSRGFGVGPHGMPRSVDEHGATLSAEWRLHTPKGRVVASHTLVDGVARTWTEVAPDGSARVLYTLDASSSAPSPSLGGHRLMALDARGRVEWHQTALGDEVFRAAIAGVSSAGATTLLLDTSSGPQVMRVGTDGAIAWVVALGSGTFASSGASTREDAVYLIVQSPDTFASALVKLDADGQTVWERSLSTGSAESVHRGPDGSALVADWDALRSVSADGQRCTRWQFDSEPLVTTSSPPPAGGPPAPPPSPRLFCNAEGLCSAPRIVLDGMGGLFAAGPDVVARLRLAP